MCLEILRDQQVCAVDKFPSYTKTIKVRGTVLVWYYTEQGMAVVFRR